MEISPICLNTLLLIHFSSKFGRYDLGVEMEFGNYDVRTINL
jgi:hypothetical protein